ncbi:Zinc finger protein basonuclin-2 [Trichinella pseudospiralis]|uniref:Zinc finger protein basonuclin-2 n=1 Tax=Trichinella pseudospiralis TaxID=6337 RepID=A0A0V0Y9H7_TRIPS|nr:Zinc finger protein basonuclin-2 [Trichinella pseudospiralis]
MPTVPADQANMDQNLDNNALFNMSNIHHCLSVASCSIANCRCANFNADVNNTRYCDQCHHSWFSHGMYEKVVFSILFMPGKISSSNSNSIYPMSTMLYYTQ